MVNVAPPQFFLNIQCCPAAGSNGNKGRTIPILLLTAVTKDFQIISPFGFIVLPLFVESVAKAEMNPESRSYIQS